MIETVTMILGVGLAVLVLWAMCWIIYAFFVVFVWLFALGLLGLFVLFVAGMGAGALGIPI